MWKKLEVGAAFFQTQPVFDSEVFMKFLEKAGEIPVPILGGVLLLKSAGMARFMDEKVPGVKVPENFMRKMEETPDPVPTAIQIAARLVNEIMDVCTGVHIMTLQEKDKVPLVLEAASLI